MEARLVQHAAHGCKLFQTLGDERRAEQIIHMRYVDAFRHAMGSS